MIKDIADTLIQYSSLVEEVSQYKLSIAPLIAFINPYNILFGKTYSNTDKSKYSTVDKIRRDIGKSCAMNLTEPGYSTFISI